MNLRIVFIVVALALQSGCVSSGDRPLRFLSGEETPYPESARAQGVEGYVVVRYDVSVEGVVTNATVLESQPPGVFDEAAIAAVSAWRFSAPTVGGVPQPAPARQSRLDFKLGAGEEYER